MRTHSLILLVCCVFAVAGCNSGKSSSGSPAVADSQVVEPSTVAPVTSTQDQAVSTLMSVRQGFSGSPSAFVQSFEAVLPNVDSDGKVSVNGASSTSLSQAESQIIQMIDSDAPELKMLPATTIAELQSVCASALSQLQALDVSDLSSDLQALVAADIAILQELQKQL